MRRKSRGPDGAKVVMQHAAVLDESAFMDMEEGEFALDSSEVSDNACKVFHDPLRFLRSRTEGLGDTEVTFGIDLMGRGRS